MSHTVETITSDDGRRRVRIVLDETGGEPYDDGSLPAVRIYFRSNGATASQLAEMTSYQLPREVIYAAERWARETDIFERYLRVFHGMTRARWIDTRDGDTFVTFDTAHWRESVGVTAEQLAAEDIGAELRAWIDGECYGLVPERLDTWTRESFDDDEEDTSEERWTEDDSVVGTWGLYGSQYAEQAARELLAEMTEEPDVNVCRYCGRAIELREGRWIDPAATGDDSVWRETCDAHDTRVADHEPVR